MNSTEVRERLAAVTQDLGDGDRAAVGRLVHDVHRDAQEARRKHEEASREVQTLRGREAALSQEVLTFRHRNEQLEAKVRQLEGKVKQMEGEAKGREVPSTVDVGELNWTVLEALGGLDRLAEYDLGLKASLIEAGLAKGLPRLVRWAASLSPEGLREVLHLGFSEFHFYATATGRVKETMFQFGLVGRGESSCWRCSRGAVTLYGEGLLSDRERLAGRIARGELVLTGNAVHLPGEAVPQELLADDQ